MKFTHKLCFHYTSLMWHIIIDILLNRQLILTLLIIITVPNTMVLMIAMIITSLLQINNGIVVHTETWVVRQEITNKSNRQANLILPILTYGTHALSSLQCASAVWNYDFIVERKTDTLQCGGLRGKVFSYFTIGQDAVQCYVELLIFQENI